MKPTNKFRWIEVKKGQVEGGEAAPGRFGPNNLTLQQWWEPEPPEDVLPEGERVLVGEWRDVPIEG